MEQQAILLLLLFFCAGGIEAFVYSCEEVRYQLINSDIEHNTTSVCVVTEENFSNWDQLKEISVTPKGPSFFDGGCITKNATDPSWRVVVADSAFVLNCKQEFTLIFTSDPDIDFLYPVQKPHGWELETWLQEGERTIVFIVPQTKMWFQLIECRGKGTVTISSGAGVDESEQLVFMRSFTCATVPQVIYSCDNVVSVTITDDINYRITVSSDMGSYGSPPIPQVSYGDYLFFESSGQSDNLQNSEGKTDCRAFVNVGTKQDVTVEMQVELDPRNNGFVAIQKNAGGQVYKYDNGSRTEVFSTDYFEVRYEPSELLPQNIGTSLDNVLIDVYIGPPPPKTTTAPSTTTTTATDKGYCGCEMDELGTPIGWELKQIWLDVVVILDASEAMSAAGLRDAIDLIDQGMFYQLAGGQDGLVTDPSAPFYTRIGVIGMSDKAEIFYNLNMTSKDKMAGKLTIKEGVTQINLNEAFYAAVNMFNDGLQTDPGRVNTRQVIYYMTNSHPGALHNQLNQFKAAEGIIMITSLGNEEVPALKSLASEGYYFANTAFDVLSSFCKANCFCAPVKSAYGGGADPAIQASGGCYIAVPSGVSFNKAKATCASEGGIIASTHDDAKGHFVQELLSKTASKSHYYWIGYEKSGVDGAWRWEDQSTDPYTNWNEDEPHVSAVASCAYVDLTQAHLPWGAGNCLIGFPYVCESTPCSVGNKNC